MKRQLVLAPVTLGLLVAACGGSTPPSASIAGARAASSSNVTVATHRTKLGTVLADSRGRTLYLFEKDKGTTSACNGACASVWPPLLVTGGPAVAARGALSAKLGTGR